MRQITVRSARTLKSGSVQICYESKRPGGVGWLYRLPPLHSEEWEQLKLLVDAVMKREEKARSAS